MLELKNICKEYDGKVILDNVSINIPNGDILTIVGPSGGGKTTLLRCIAGLVEMDSGTIKIDGELINPAGRYGGKNEIGVVFQEFNLFPHLSVMDNIILAPTLVAKLSKEEATKQAERLLHILDLEAHAEKMPFQLSGGQKQRVAIARALAMKPKVLCYDEPTSALDPNLINNVAEIILNLKQEHIIQIIVTHDHVFAEKVADLKLELEAIK